MQGEWGVCSGTPIAPRHFITAKHIGGAAGDAFRFRGANYQTVARHDDPGSDLTLWEVSAAFPAFASLYEESDELGKRLVVFGRGANRGDSVSVGGVFGPEAKGWRWGAMDGVLRWGENVITSVDATGGAFSVLTGGSAVTGPLLRAEFNAAGGENEATLAVGDSGGGVFIESGGVWRLAGVNYAVDGPYNTEATGPGFFGAIFDEGGLFKGGAGAWQPVPDLPTEQASGFYATRISARLSWIQSVVGAATEGAPKLEWAGSLPGAFEEDSAAVVDLVAKTVRTALPAGARFYRLNGETEKRLRSIAVDGENLLMTYE